MKPEDPDYPAWIGPDAIEPGRAMFRTAFETSEGLGQPAGAIALGLLESGRIDPSAPGFRMLDLIVRVEHELQLRMY